MLISLLGEYKTMDAYKVFDNIVKQTPVWVAGVKANNVTCEVCGGDGYFVVVSRYKDVPLTLDCPCCHGVGKKEKMNYVPHSVLLDCIYRLTDYVIMVRDKRGNSYNLDSIYETKEECQVELDRECKGNE